MLPLTVAIAALMRSCEMSLSTTSRPASAHTWAMPLPICPAPITPTLRMVCAIFFPLASSAPVVRRCGLPSSLNRPVRCFTANCAALPPACYATFDLRLPPKLSKLLRKLRKCLVEVGNKSVISDLKDGRFLVLVDGDNDLRILHAGEMLNGS